ncbi:MAG TPA: polyphosphate kinase 2 family protein [Planctomycetaceae bacterium]|nr:polyphosphate kinase 2 family protein [Planctomycetaceae bacterium]
MKDDNFIELCRVKPGTTVRLEDFDPGWNGNREIPKADRKRQAHELLADGVQSLAKAQELLYADNSWSLLVIFQALDSAGKDSAIKHVMSGVNPQGCQVFSFKHPSAEELDHNFLWRCMKALPERGRIGIFNRSYYEEVLIVKVHPELVHAQRIPGADPDSDGFWETRYEDINAFEHHLSRNGTVIVKFFLHLSKEEQRQRFLKRLTDPEKHWKFSPRDIEERSFWDDYIRTYEQMLTATSTPWAPWYVVPADHKWATRAIVASVLSETIESLKLRYPELTPEEQQHIDDARRQLENQAPKR